jgi:glycosyltransferase involved in cell wall biosynthesis
MKILVVQDFMRSGGTERQSVLLANAFAAAGHDATLLTFRPGGALACPEPVERAAAVPGNVTLRALQPFDLGLDWFAPGLMRAVATAAPAIVLCMGRMANCRAGGIQKNSPAAAVIATMRTGKPLPWLFRRSLRLARHIVANSHEARDNLVAHHGISAGKISVIYNSLVFPPASAVWRNAPLRAQHGATATTTVLLCVAMFRPEKNQRELIEIVSGLPEQFDWQLWLVGDGPARAACEALVAARQLGDRVKFLGFVRDPSPLYCAADLAVHASRSEALSNFLIEAQAHGLLAIASEAQGIRECFVPGRTGWAIPRDDRALFRATLTRRMSEPAVSHAERSADARAFARTTFDPARQVAAYLALFQKLAATSAP